MSAAVDAVVALEFQLMEMGAVLEAFADMAGDAPPPWLAVIQAEFGRLESAMEPVSEKVRSGGMGAVAPMVAQKVVRPAPGRGTSSGSAVEDAARPDKQ